MSSHTLLIIIHAIAATIALLAGLIALRSRHLVIMHAYAIIAMTATLIGAVLTHPNGSTATTTINVGLCGVALIMTAQAILALRRRPGRHRAAIGFNCIGLVTAFVAVSTVQLTSNAFIDVAVPVATIFVGRIALRRLLDPDDSRVNA